MESLIFLAKKRDGSIKARTCANGITQRSFISCNEATSPMAATDAVLLTGVIKAKEKRDVITMNTSNAFVQTDIPEQKEKMIMKIRGVLVDILIDLCPRVYEEHFVMERGKKVLYAEMLKTLYRMLVSSLL
eukprot:11527315-Ditylum_brightwellii.AAC.1